MNTIIFKTASAYLLPLLLMFSIFILLRGHYLPGGGFVGGLIASIAFVIYLFANGLDKTRTIIRIDPKILIPIGLFVAFASGTAPLLDGQAFMTGLWLEDPVPVIGLVGSALFFDTGVYLVVIGVTLTIIFSITETI